MGVVLGEAAYTGHAAEFAGLLPSVDGAELGKAYGQVAVGVWLSGEDLDVHWAVHWLEEVAVDFAAVEVVRELGARAAFLGECVEGFTLGYWAELGGFVVGKVPGGAVEPEFTDVRGEDLLVALFLEKTQDEVLKLLSNDSAFRLPEDKALAYSVVDVKEAEGFAEFAVVPIFGFFDALKFGGEFLLGWECGAIDALELAVALIAFVIGAGDAEEFKRFDCACGGQVCAGAEVSELTVPIVGYRGLSRDVCKAFEFVGLIAFSKKLSGLLAGDLDPFEGLVLSNNFSHLILQGFEVFGGEGVLEIEVVVKAAWRWRAYVKFGIGK